MTNNIGWTPLDVDSVSKETDINAIAERIDGRSTAPYIVVKTDDGLAVTITSTNWRISAAIIFDPDGSSPPGAGDGFTLNTTNIGVGRYYIINNLACPITFGSFSIPSNTGQSFFWTGSALHQAGTDFEPQVYKEAVRVVADAPITIATALNSGDVIDGVTLANGDRVLPVAQAAPEENVVWIVGATPVVASDFDTDGDVLPGTSVFVREGTHAGNYYNVTNAAPPVVGVDGVTWAEFSGGGGGSATFIGLTDVPANFTNAEYKLVRVNATPDALEFIDDMRPLQNTFGGQPTAAQTVFSAMLPWDMDFPANFAGSTIRVGVDPAANYDFDILLEGVSVGSATITAGSFTATFTASAFSGDKDDILTITGDATPDADLEDIWMNIFGKRVS